MRKPAHWIGTVLLLAVLAGCTTDEGPDPTVPPVAPNHQIAGSVLPGSVAGYTVMGSAPTADQLTATYSRDAQPLDLVVVTLDPSGESGRVKLSGQQWYGTSRCGVLWTGDPKATPQPQQVACVTVLTDGVMAMVSGGDQTAEDLAALATAMSEMLA